jgi:hypothetical protein
MEKGSEVAIQQLHGSDGPTGIDGIQEQVILLNNLSRSLDEYFALRTTGSGPGGGGLWT